MKQQPYKTTALGPLPQEWEVVRLGELIIQSNNKNKTAMQYPVYTISNKFGFLLSDEFFDKRVYSMKLNTYKIVKKNYFAYNPYRINVGSIGLFKQDIGVVSPAYIVFKIKDDERLFANFLFRIIKSQFYIYEIMRFSMSRGSVRRNLSFKDLSDLIIPLPPLSEQRKIAYVLSTIQAAKEKTEQVINSLRELKKSMMKHLFTYGPVSLEDAKKVKLKETEIGMVPEDWEVVRLGSIFSITSGKTRPKMLKKTATDPYVFPVFGGNGIIGYSNDFLLDYTTIILGRVGEYCGSVHISHEKCWVSDNALYIKHFQKEIDITYLSHALEILNLNGLKNTGGQPLISQSIVYSQYIPLPPLPIQQRIASILSAIDEKIQAEENKKKALENLFKSMLHNLMTAKIRVNNLELNQNV